MPRVGCGRVCGSGEEGLGRLRIWLGGLGFGRGTPTWHGPQAALARNGNLPSPKFCTMQLQALLILPTLSTRPFDPTPFLLPRMSILSTLSILSIPSTLPTPSTLSALSTPTAHPAPALRTPYIVPTLHTCASGSPGQRWPSAEYSSTMSELRTRAKPTKPLEARWMECCGAVFSSGARVGV